MGSTFLFHVSVFLYACDCCFQDASLTKKDGLFAILFSHPPSFLSYFFVVFLVAFETVFFVVPQAAPLDLQAIINLLHNKDNFKLAQSMRAVNKRTALTQPPCRQPHGRDIIVHVLLSGRKLWFVLYAKKSCQQTSIFRGNPPVPNAAETCISVWTAGSFPNLPITNA